MSPGQLRKEVMRLRRAFRKEFGNTGDRRCWINLLQAHPDGEVISPLSLSREEFLRNYNQYHDRNSR